jgi:hypothetical protein
MTRIVTAKAQRQADNVARQRLEPVYEPHTSKSRCGCQLSPHQSSAAQDDAAGCLTHFHRTQVNSLAAITV